MSNTQYGPQWLFKDLVLAASGSVDYGAGAGNGPIDISNGLGTNFYIKVVGSGTATIGLKTSPVTDVDADDWDDYAYEIASFVVSGATAGAWLAPPTHMDRPIGTIAAKVTETSTTDGITVSLALMRNLT